MCKKQTNEYKQINTEENTFPDDIREYINRYTHYTTIIVDKDLGKITKYPDDVYDSNSITFDNIKNHCAVSWAKLSNVYEGIVYVKRSSGSFSENNKPLRKSSTLTASTNIEKNWTMKINEFNLQEFNPGHMIQINKGYLFTGDNNFMKLFDEERKYIITSILLSNENLDYSIMIVKDDSLYFKNKYMFVINKNYIDYMVLKTNIPELYVYENLSYNIYNNYPRHLYHTKIKEAESIQAEYRKLDMNETTNASYINKRFIIKPLFEKNNQVTLFLNELESIKNGLSKTSHNNIYIPHITKPEVLLSLPSTIVNINEETTIPTPVVKHKRVIDDLNFDNTLPVISPSPSMKSIISNSVRRTNLSNTNLSKVPSTSSNISYRTTSSLMDPNSIHYMD